MRTKLASLWVWSIALVLIVLWTPSLAVVRLFDRDPARYRTGRWFRRLGATLSRLHPMWDIQVTGDLPADPRRPYVVVCNHQSLADIPVISRLPWEMKWVAKDVLFRLPFAGWMMKLAGDIEVARGDKRSRAEVLVKARRMLDRRCSVMLFPEGTRSRDGQVGTFAHGAFRLAIKAGVPVLPLAIDGTLDALPKNRWTFDQMDAPMRLKVLPPVPTDGLKLSDAPVLTEQVRGMVVKQLATWRGAPVEAIDGGEAGADFSRPSG